MKNIFAKIVSKKSKASLPEESILVTPSFLFATNLYTAIKVRMENFRNEDFEKIKIITSRVSEMDNQMTLLKPNEIDMKKSILETMPFDESAERYPVKDVEALFPSESSLELNYTSVIVDPKTLSDIATAMQKTYGSSYASVKLYVPKIEGKPVVLKRANDLAIGLIMPQHHD